jgi:hypothetical protein
VSWRHENLTQIVILSAKVCPCFWDQLKLVGKNVNHLPNSKIVNAGVFALEQEAKVFDGEKMRQSGVKLRRVMLQSSQQLVKHGPLVVAFVNGAGDVETDKKSWDKMYQKKMKDSKLEIYERSGPHLGIKLFTVVITSPMA